jgi:hypothetical protein
LDVGAVLVAAGSGGDFAGGGVEDLRGEVVADAVLDGHSEESAVLTTGKGMALGRPRAPRSHHWALAR